LVLPVHEIQEVLHVGNELPVGPEYFAGVL
jgi:hypothetical protein